MKIILNDNELDWLDKQDPADRANGGFQQFLVDLQSRVDRTSNALVLRPKDLEKIPRYAFDYGNGGWERRLREIFERSLGSRLGRSGVS